MRKRSININMSVSGLILVKMYSPLKLGRVSPNPKLEVPKASIPYVNMVRDVISPP